MKKSTILIITTLKNKCVVTIHLQHESWVFLFYGDTFAEHCCVTVIMNISLLYCHIPEESLCYTLEILQRMQKTHKTDLHKKEQL